MRNFVRTVLDTLFPRRCIGCRTPGMHLCAACARSVPGCEPIAPAWITAVWSYKNPLVKKLLWRMKFERRFAIAYELALYAGEHLSAELFERAIFENTGDLVLVPIPLSRAGKRKRGYNQSEILARELARALGDWPVELLLAKVRETAAQHTARNRRERLSNLKGAYRAAPETLGKNILLIDDITTTHATFAEARRALKAAGAKRVLAFAIAH